MMGFSYLFRFDCADWKRMSMMYEISAVPKCVFSQELIDRLINPIKIMKR